MKNLQVGYRRADSMSGNVVLEKEGMYSRENPLGGICRSWQPLGSAVWRKRSKPSIGNKRLALQQLRRGKPETLWVWARVDSRTGLNLV